MQHPGEVKKLGKNNTEKNPTNSTKNLGTSVTQGKRKRIYIYYIYNQTRLRMPPQLEHSFHPEIFSTLTHPKVIDKSQVHCPGTVQRL